VRQAGVHAEMSDNPLLSAALEYAARGWCIFPLHSIGSGQCTCHKHDCKRKGKHPRTRNGLKDATDNVEVINGWWGKWQDANIGLLTGAESGFIVLDVDDKDGVYGSESLQRFSEDYGWNGQTLMSITGNGRHLLFQHPGQPIKNSASTVAPGLDVRGEGGYIVAPPSVHFTGKQYRWQDPAEPIAELPEWLLEHIVAPHQVLTPATCAIAPEAESIANGNRNTELTRIAGRLRRNGLDESSIAESLIRENEKRCTPALARSEILRIARSVARYEPAEANLYWMKLTMSDWDGSVIVKSGTSSERGMYASLIVESWRRRGVLPDGPQLWRLAQADSAVQFQEARDFVLSEFISTDRDRQHVLVHPRIAQLWADQSRKYRQKVEAGRKSGEKRRSRSQKTRLLTSS
jgi:uncharacterized protein YdaU (DUF1376 family)